MHETDGHCRVFLKETAEYHDRTMEHPLMQSIYDLRITDNAYVHYLQCMREIFAALETADAVERLPAALADRALLRYQLTSLTYTRNRLVALWI